MNVDTSTQMLTDVHNIEINFDTSTHILTDVSNIKINFDTSIQMLTDVRNTRNKYWHLIGDVDSCTQHEKQMLTL